MNSPKTSRTQQELVEKDRVFLSKKKVDRSNWKRKAYEENPQVLELVERILPIERVLSFGRIYVPHRKEIKETVSKNDIVQLILQYLHIEGLKESRRELELAAKQKLNPALIEMEQSRLIELLRIPIKATERVWDLTMADKSLDDEENMQELEDLLYDMGMLEENPEFSEDVNLWEEEEEDNVLYAADGVTLKGATLNQLVQKLTYERDHDMDFQKTFLMTYQSFTTPEKLLKKLIQRYHVPEKEGQENSMKNTIQLRTINVMKKWLSGQVTDLNEQHIESFKIFLDKHLKNRSEGLYKQLQKELRKKLNYAHETKKQLVFSEPPPEPKVEIKNIFNPHLKIFDVDELEVARQLTIIEFEYFAKIKPSELLNQAWNKPKLKHRATNVLNMINRFNEVSMWVACSILKEERLRNRARLFTKLIKIGEQLFKLQNLSTMMAIIAGINHAAVHRLKFTREEVPRQTWASFEQMMDAVSSANGFRNYRNYIANVAPPCIPYLGVYLTDLTFIDEGNPNFVKSPSGKKELINFAKRKLVYSVISSLQQLQQTSYNLQPVHQILTLLSNEKLRTQMLDEKDMWKFSQLREPRDADRASLKQLVLFS